MTKVVSFRVKPEELAKALEGLEKSGADPANLTTISNIVRTTFYHGIIALCEKPSSPAGNDALQKINQLSVQNKRNKPAKITDLL